MVIGWRAWYVIDGTPRTFESSNTAYEDLPNDGCLGFVYYESRLTPAGRPTRRIDVGHDYYFKSGEIYGSDIESRDKNCKEDINLRYEAPHIIRGIWVDDDTFDLVQEEMREALTCP